MLTMPSPHFAVVSSEAVSVQCVQRSGQTTRHRQHSSASRLLLVYLTHRQTYRLLSVQHHTRWPPAGEGDEVRVSSKHHVTGVQRGLVSGTQQKVRVSLSANLQPPPHETTCLRPSSLWRKLEMIFLFRELLNGIDHMTDARTVVQGVHCIDSM